MKLCSYTLCMYLYQYPSLQYMDISAATHCLHKKYLITSKKYRIYLRIWYHRTLFAVNKVFLLCIVSNCIFIVFFFFYISVFIVFPFFLQHICSDVPFRCVYSFVISTIPTPFPMRQTSRDNGQLVNIFYFYKFTRFLYSFF